MQAEIAVLRFGLGARPGDLAAAAGEPRAWLMAQIKGAVPLAGKYAARTFRSDLSPSCWRRASSSRK